MMITIQGENVANFSHIFFFKGGEVGVDGEVAPPPVGKEPGFSSTFLD